MIPLDKLHEEILSPQYAQTLLKQQEYEAFSRFTPQEHKALLHELLTQPIARFTVINELFFRSKWAQCTSAIHKDGPVTLLEVASGDADMIPQMLARIRPGSVYLTANSNQRLNESLLQKTEGLPLQFQLIDDDAAKLKQYVEPGSVDIVAFQHGINDVLQAILCDQRGVDTIEADWMKVLPTMITLMQEQMEAGTLEHSVKAPFLSLLETLLYTLKPGGIIAANHYQFQLDLDWGYPKELFEQMIPVVREWVKDLDGCKEIFLPGFEPQWWLFLKKE